MLAPVCASFLSVRPHDSKMMIVRGKQSNYPSYIFTSRSLSKCEGLPKPLKLPFQVILFT